MLPVKFLTRPILSLFVIIITCIVIITSCDSTDNQNDLYADNNQNTAYTELINALEEYAAHNSVTNSSLSRGDLGWKKFKEAVKADFVSGNNGRGWFSPSASKKNGMI